MPQTKENPSIGQAAAQARFDSLMVHVEPGLASSHRTEFAAQLARKLGARLIGVGAESIGPMPASDPYGGMLTAEWMSAMLGQIDADLKSAEEAFRRDSAGAEAEWRVVQDAPAKAVARAARAADLIIAGGTEKGADAYRRADAADLALQSGKPILVMPFGASHLHAATILVAWKDTREARRALADALPFLAAAEEIVIMSVCAEDAVESAKAQTADVVQALRHRGLPARSHVVSAPDASVADELNAEASAIGADLIVMGAYGQSRVKEWVLGGATRELLGNPQRFLLISH